MRCRTSSNEVLGGRICRAPLNTENSVDVLRDLGTDLSDTVTSNPQIRVQRVKGGHSTSA